MVPCLIKLSYVQVKSTMVQRLMSGVSVLFYTHSSAARCHLMDKTLK